MEYYIITPTMASKYNGLIKGNFGLNFVRLNTGEWAINVGCNEDIFTEINWAARPKRNIEPNEINPYYANPLINGYSLINVIDNYNDTITINLYKEGEFTTISSNYTDTWTDEDVNEAINNL